MIVTASAALPVITKCSAEPPITKSLDIEFKYTAFGNVKLDPSLVNKLEFIPNSP